MVKPVEYWAIAQEVEDLRRELQEDSGRVSVETKGS